MTHSARPNVNYTITADAGGTVTSSYMGSPALVPEGATVAYSATPSTGYVFKEWVATGITTPTLSSGSFVMPTTAVSLRATFEEVIPNPSILYFKGSGANTTLEVGTWGIEITADNYASVMAFFKFGSVVGFDLTGTVTGSMTAVKFNPSTVTPTDYGTIPVYASTDYSNNILDVSASTWHNSTNVPLGKGDPCRLVGLTAAQVKAGSIDSGQYRLPTLSENQAFVGSTSSSESAGSAYYTVSGGWSSTDPGVGTFPVGGISLPAAGYRNTSGSVYNQGEYGRYWSSTVRDSTYGYNLAFDSSSVSPSGTASYAFGFPIRCVRQ